MLTESEIEEIEIIHRDLEKRFNQSSPSKTLEGMIVYSGLSSFPTENSYLHICIKKLKEEEKFKEILSDFLFSPIDTYLSILFSGNLSEYLTIVRASRLLFRIRKNHINFFEIDQKIRLEIIEKLENSCAKYPSYLSTLKELGRMFKEYVENTDPVSLILKR